MAKQSNTWQGKTKAELNKALVEKKEAIRAIRFGASGSKSTNVKSVKNLRREVARIMSGLATAK